MFKAGSRCNSGVFHKHASRLKAMFCDPMDIEDVRDSMDLDANRKAEDEAKREVGAKRSAQAICEAGAKRNVKAKRKVGADVEADEEADVEADVEACEADVEADVEACEADVEADAEACEADEFRGSMPDENALGRFWFVEGTPISISVTFEFYYANIVQRTAK